ncbi:hypothetical protein CY34DRAFT_801757 [Suillus luteus UH-Slu-Lm8-n1]|uniref:Uncharacterized protein n=1 Tax=Suillus luteus UH-Slu-Lm8-n1 TaxID=930992 RepID=A0A0D0BGY9_9AGAM|nr:hypothetical protein CY34DRAFT_801757 [Suillus luteus UH-Slu-Lm8-n1]
MVIGEGAAEEQSTGVTFRTPEVCEVSVGQANFSLLSCCNSVRLSASGSRSPRFPLASTPGGSHPNHQTRCSCI